MTLGFWESVAMIGVMAVLTFFTRLIPFAIFRGDKPVPGWVRYLGIVLPATIIATLVIYCLKNVEFLNYPSGIPELISVALVAGLHIWKRNTLISIGAGVLCYMILIRTVYPLP